MNRYFTLFAVAAFFCGMMMALPTGCFAQVRINPPSNTQSEQTTGIASPRAIDTNGLVSVLEFSPATRASRPEIRDQFDVSPELNRIFTDIVLNNMPHEYVSDKKWGKQEKRWDGIAFRRDEPGGRLETKRRYKMVNHGTWRKYSAVLADPKNQFSVELSDVQRGNSGLTRFWINFGAGLELDARQAKWVKGVQLYSFSAQGFAKVRLSVLCDLDIGIDFSQFPPDLVLQPVVRDAKLHVDEFRLHRISKAGGEFAQQVSRLARKELDDKILEKERELVKKINEEIEENRDDLRISTADAIKSKWFNQHKELLPDQVHQALTK